MLAGTLETLAMSVLGTALAACAGLLLAVFVAWVALADRSSAGLRRALG